MGGSSKVCLDPPGAVSQHARCRGEHGPGEPAWERRCNWEGTYVTFTLKPLCYIDI